MSLTFHLFLRIFLLFVIAFMLTILPLPQILKEFRPSWILLLVLYMNFFLPNCIGLSFIVFVGLCLDTLLSTLLGIHVFALVIALMIASIKAKRFVLFSMPKQLGFVALICFSYQLVLYVIDFYQGFNYTFIMVIVSVIASIMVWPWVSLLLDRYFSSYIIISDAT